MGVSKGRAVLLLLGLVTLVCLSVLLQVALRIERGAEQYGVDKYAVYIDGGSSGTRVRVFRYRSARWPEYVSLVLPEPSSAIEPGLSAYADRPLQAAESLQPLLDFAYEHVPSDVWPVTPVRLLATAGLRLLTDRQQADILVACASRLAASHFAFEPGWAEVIGGELEGLYGWAAVNYITGALQEASGHAHHSRKEVIDPAQLFTGILEMGGASMQLTFLPPAHAKLTERHGSQLHLPGVPSRLYAHSYLGLGMDAALARAADFVLEHSSSRSRGVSSSSDISSSGGSTQGRVLTAVGGDDTDAARGMGSIPDPCLPIGYVTEDGRYGNGSFSQCLDVVHRILPDHNCSAAAPANTLGRHGGGGSSSSGSTGTRASGLGHAGRTLTSKADAMAGAQSGQGTVAKAGDGAQDVAPSESYGNEDEVVSPGDKDSGGSSSSSIGAGSKSGGHGGGGSGGGGGGCVLQGSYVPSLAGTFVAVENFAWTARALGLPPRSTLRELREHGARYCSRHWSSLHAEFSGHIPDQFLVRYCFGAAYILALLHTGLGFSLDDGRLTWTNTVPHAASGEQVPLNWVLGAAVVDAMNEAGRGGGGAGGGGGGSARFWSHEEGSRAAFKAGSAVLVLPLAALAIMALALAFRLRGSGGGGGGSAAAKGAAAGRAHGVTVQAITPGIGLGGGSSSGGGVPRPSRFAGGAITPPGVAVPSSWTAALTPVGAGAEVMAPQVLEGLVQEPALGRSSVSEARSSFGDSGSDGAMVGFVSSRVNALRAQNGGGSGTTMRRNPSFTTVLIGDGGSSVGQGAPHGGR
ncbi:hypothetical protein HYH02_006878 [Chlamydomonas schloesseri]|uniref:Apyrase n=1 Tax=Chlamydomonas schloesseri TaxID=2026947 RepID=A0A835WJD2_9CHLO|nr:hypothetical protein HYH02_006878 [Chlamydomonas schloesseri]|eukprot:KAG2448294.1 hypothetical protein HYH02_006878 [Chlamydomonas schloesseri]